MMIFGVDVDVFEECLICCFCRTFQEILNLFFLEAAATVAAATVAAAMTTAMHDD